MAFCVGSLMSLCLSQTNLGTTNPPSARKLAGAINIMRIKTRRNSVRLFIKIQATDFNLPLNQAELTWEYSCSRNLTSCFPASASAQFPLASEAFVVKVRAAISSAGSGGFSAFAARHSAARRDDGLF